MRTFRRSAAMMTRLLLTMIAIVGVAGSPSSTRAAQGDWQSYELLPGTWVEARLIAAVDAVGTAEGVPAGLHIRLPGEWKTYWRSPGDAGYPPRLDLDGSINLAGHDMAWPAPHRFTLFGIDTFGYADEIVFPLTLTPAQAGEAMLVRGTLDLLVCTDVCVPADFDLSLILPAGPAIADAEAAHLIDRFADQVPQRDGMVSGLAIDDLSAAGPVMTVSATARTAFEQPDLFVEAGDRWAFAQPEITFSDDGRRLTASIAATEQPAADASLVGETVIVTLVDGRRSVEREAAVVEGIPAAPVPQAGVASWIAILATALLGGLILNLMPCVLPVLSLKVFSFASQGGRNAGEVRIGFVATAAGIVVSFLLLAGGLIALQLAGATVGWGIQFQQPIFLIAMTLVVTLFACNLFGLFEITLPFGLADRAARVGQGDGLTGHFATGMFATLLATPCSAPFVGTAVAFALSQGPVEITSVFLALGIGLAAPYLVIAVFPRLATRLPRPGRWMIWLRAVLGLALVATAVWLLSVVAAQVPPNAAVTVAVLMIAVAALLAWRRFGPGKLRQASAAMVPLAAVLAIAAPSAFPPGERAAQAEPDGLWQAFDPAAIAGMVAGGQVVLVDVTADWCLTCQVNEALVLDSETIRERLSADGVVAMQGDWTRPDPAIAAFLASHDRYGIPFNAVFGPAAPEGILLPELLTADGLTEALDRAGGAAAQTAAGSS